VGQDILALGKYEVAGVSGGAPSGVDVTVSTCGNCRCLSLLTDLSMQLLSPLEEYEYQAQGRGQGKFAFTAKIEGVHKLCFANNGMLCNSIPQSDAAASSVDSLPRWAT
jgi:hypothetical protein